MLHVGCASSIFTSGRPIRPCNEWTPSLGQRREKAKKDRQVTRRVMENVERLEQEAEILERKTNEKRLEAETLAELENTGKR